MLIQIKQGNQWYGGTRRQTMLKLDNFLLYPTPVTGFLEVPQIFNNPKQLMHYMSLLMHREILACGVSPAQQRLLEEVYRGRGKTVSALWTTECKGETNLARQVPLAGEIRHEKSIT